MFSASAVLSSGGFCGKRWKSEELCSRVSRWTVCLGRGWFCCDTYWLWELELKCLFVSLEKEIFLKLFFSCKEHYSEIGTLKNTSTHLVWWSGSSFQELGQPSLPTFSQCGWGGQQSFVAGGMPVARGCAVLLVFLLFFVEAGNEWT